MHVRYRLLHTCTAGRPHWTAKANDVGIIRPGHLDDANRDPLELQGNQCLAIYVCR